MKNRTVKGIIALAVVTALSFGVIIGSKALSTDMTGNTGTTEAKVTEKFDVSSEENIDEAVKTENGYEVTVRQKGYGGDIVMKVSFDDTAATVTKLEILEQNETEGLGSKITEDGFLNQFNGITAPVYVPGMSLETEDGTEDSSSEKTSEFEVLDDATFTDGTYTAKAEPDSNGFTEEVTMTVKDGKITEVNWDAVLEDGTKKSVMSENGEYVMTEDGPTWKEQAEALADALIQNQSISFLTTNAEGKTDAVSGVSISVGGFISLAADCMAQSAGVELDTTQKDGAEDTSAQDGTQIDAVSGATVSSTAVATGINHAYSFLQTVK